MITRRSKESVMNSLHINSESYDDFCEDVELCYAAIKQLPISGFTLKGIFSEYMDAWYCSLNESGNGGFTAYSANEAMARAIFDYCGVDITKRKHLSNECDTWGQHRSKMGFDVYAPLKELKQEVA